MKKLNTETRSEVEALRAIYDRRAYALAVHTDAMERARNLTATALRVSRMCRACGIDCAMRIFTDEARARLRSARVARLSSTMGARLP